MPPCEEEGLLMRFNTSNKAVARCGFNLSKSSEFSVYIPQVSNNVQSAEINSRWRLARAKGQAWLCVQSDLPGTGARDVTNVLRGVESSLVQSIERIDFRRDGEVGILLAREEMRVIRSCRVGKDAGEI